jgi:hypothetical protein
MKVWRIMMVVVKSALATLASLEQATPTWAIVAPGLSFLTFRHLEVTVRSLFVMQTAVLRLAHAMLLSMELPLVLRHLIRQIVGWTGSMKVLLQTALLG